MTGTPSILYLVHDIADPAVKRRVAMLKDGGANVTLIGFTRTDAKIPNAIDLGRTYDGNFLQRLGSVLAVIGRIQEYKRHFTACDLIIARNMEMLAIAVRGKRFSPSVPLVYECLDIHRLLLGQGLASRALRWLEGQLCKRASLLLTSSPAFIREYFDTRSSVRLPSKLVENKVYGIAPVAAERTPARPWRIGWFGAIRCRKSLDILRELVRASNGAVEVVIRGRPALDQFDDFHRAVSSVPGLRFAGSYEYPADLASIYNEVHFTWAIDMFEEGLNSSWLLPNRLYEGCAHGAVPIAVSSVETGRFLSELRIGVPLPQPLGASLAAFFAQLTEAQYRTLAEAVGAVPKERWVCGAGDCRELVSYLTSLKSSGS